MAYGPGTGTLERYASVLVDFALGGGAGIEQGDVVRVSAPESAKPLYLELCRAVWRAGGNVIGGYLPGEEQPGGGSSDFFELASDAPIPHFPAHYPRGLVDEMAHQVAPLCHPDPHPPHATHPTPLLP